MTEVPPPETHLSDVIAGYITAYRQVDAEIRKWTEARDVLGQHIRDSLGDSEVGLLHGRPVVRWTRYTTRRLNPAKVALKLSADDLADCYVTTEARKFTVASS